MESVKSSSVEPELAEGVEAEMGEVKLDVEGAEGAEGVE